MKLKEKHAVVTGGAMGIGQVIAVALAQEGANVSIIDINPEAARETAVQIEKIGSRSLVCNADVSRAVAIDTCAQRLHKMC